MAGLKRFFGVITFALSALLAGAIGAGAQAQTPPGKPGAGAAGAPGAAHQITIRVPLSPQVDPAVIDEEAYIAASGWLVKGAAPARATTKTTRSLGKGEVPAPLAAATEVPVPQAEVQAPPQSEPQTEPQTAPQTEPQTEPQTAPQTQAAPQAERQPEPQPEAAPQPEPEPPEPEPVVQTDPDTGLQILPAGTHFRLLADTGPAPEGALVEVVKPVPPAARVENRIRPVDIAALPEAVRADYQRGLALADGKGVPADPVAAAQAFRRAAEAGHPGAAFELAWAYETDTGVAQSYPQALKWYRRAVEGGDGRAMNNLGWLYSQGIGVGKNLERAVALYHAAAEAGEASALGNLGWLKENGIGMAQDLPGAAALYRKAAAAGDSQSMLNLGELYLMGDGVEKDPGEALEWFEKAHAAGRVEALSYIGEIYEREPGLRNPKRAAAYYLRALAAGDAWAESRAGRNWDGETARAIQAILKDAQLYDGPLDGVIGPGTRAAMQALTEGGASGG